jgi:hypothetical protein
VLDPVLPDRAREDSDEAWGAERESSDSRETWLRRERPPHHEG